MHSVVIAYCGWHISCQARTVDFQDGQTFFEATALIKKSSESPHDKKNAEREAELRKEYGVRGKFGSESLAADAVIAVAKRAIDFLYS